MLAVAPLTTKAAESGVSSWISLQNAVKALNLYAQAAKAYFDSTGQNG